MSKRMKIALLVVLGLGLVLLFFYITPDKEKKIESEEDLLSKELLKQKRNKNGVYIFYSLLESYPKVLSLDTIKDPIDSNLKVTEGEFPNVYMLIDNEITISDKAVDTLMDFVEKGNTAFVSVSKFNSNFASKFVYGKLTNSIWDTEIALDFTHDTFQLGYDFYFVKYKNNIEISKYWNYFVPSNFKKGLNQVATLSYDSYMENPVFIKVAHGKGYFYLHSIPEVFFNEAMFSQDGFEYAERVMSHLPKGHYKWHSHLDLWNPKNDVNPDNSDITRESPIQYILKDVNLRYAYLLLLASLLTYVLFKTKRKQKIIPTIEPNENNSLEFIETVSKLYLKQDKHYKFIKHYEQSFMHFVKDKYYLSSPTIDKEYISSLALKSGITEELITKIFNEFSVAKKAYSYSTDKLIALHKKIEYFYKNCK